MASLSHSRWECWEALGKQTYFLPAQRLMCWEGAPGSPALGPDLRQGCPRPCTLGGHCQHSGNAEPHPGWCSIHVDPKGDPRKDDNQQAWDVHLDQIVAHLPLQVELYFDAGELPWTEERERGEPQQSLSPVDPFSRRAP